MPTALCRGHLSLMYNNKINNGKESFAVLSFKAGNDIMITSDYNKHLQEVIDAVIKEDLSIDIINEACKRVIAWKIKYLMNSKSDEDYNDNTVLTIGLTVGGIVLIGIIFYFISKCFLCKNSNENSNDKQFNDEMNGPILDNY